MNKLFTFLFSILFITIINAGTIVVQNTNDSGTGSLRQATINALDGDTIRFNPNLISSCNDTIKLSSEIAFNKGLVIKGLYNATDSLFISGQDSVRIFNVDLDSALSKTLLIDSLIFINGNSGASNGGGLNFRGGDSLFIDNTVFKNNRTEYNGGGFFTNSHFLRFSNSMILKNYSEFRGGGFCVYSAVISVFNSKIDYNSSGFVGGGFYAYYPGGEIIINRSIISNNSTVEHGGGFATGQSVSHSIKIYNSTFKENNCTKYGGGFYSTGLSSSASPIFIEASTFSNNYAGWYGGGFFSGTSSTSINHSSFNSNTSEDGGAIGLSVSRTDSVMISNSNFSNNISTINGGGVYMFSSSNIPNNPFYFSLENSTFNNNSAIRSGGAIYSTGYFRPFDLSFINCTLNQNIANRNGGGICYESSTGNSVLNSILKNCTIYDNSALNQGEGIYASTGSNVSFSLNLLSSIIVNEGGDNISNNISSVVYSQGYNILSDSISNYTVGSDQLDVDSSALKLKPLSYNGGTTKTLLPLFGSIAIDMGNLVDGSNAQNGSFTGRRDVGATETCISAVYDTVITCSNYFFGNQLCDQTGMYYDSLTNINGCDSIISLFLTIRLPSDTLPKITICEGDSVLIFGSFESATDFYYDSLIGNVIGCTGNIIDIQELVIMPSYQDTLPDVTICEGDSILLFNHFQNEGGIYYDSLTSNNCCDSILIQELIVLPIDLTTSQSDLTLTANQNGASYQWLDCSNGNIPIVGETSQNYTVISNGDYAVVVTTLNCSDTSDCISINDVNLLENKKESNITIYPNPNNGVFTIDFENNLSSNTEVNIFNVIGEKVMQIQPTNQLKQIDLTSFENGVYFVSVTNESVTKVIRIIKQ